MVENVGETKIVKRILEVITEKHYKRVGRSGNSFKTREKIDTMIDKFEGMVTEGEKIKLAENLKFAIGLQFLDWKIVERLML